MIDQYTLRGIAHRACAQRLDAATAYRNGYAAGTDGVNDTNCHFANFASPELSQAWQRGNHDAKDGKPCTP